MNCSYFSGFSIKICRLIVLLFLTAMCSAQSTIHFDNSGYQSVLQRSKSEHKPIFYFLYADWCLHCTKMKNEVFNDTVVAHFMNDNFICAWQNIEKGEGPFFKQKFHITAFPCFLFLEQNGTVLYNFNGEFQPTDFISETKTALNPEKQLPYLEKQFYEEPTSAEKCLIFLVTLKKGSERTVLNPIAQKYLATQSEEQLLSEMNWKIIANGVSDIASRPFQFVLRHQKEFAAVASAKRVQKKIVNIVSELLQPFTENLDTINYQKKRSIAQTIGLQKTDSLIFRYDLLVAERTKNWSTYKIITSQSVEKHAFKDAQVLKEIAQQYVLHVDDVTSLKLAVKWAERALELNETYDTEIVLAKLFQKTNDSISAVALALKAKIKYTALGFNTQEADDLLKGANNPHKP